MAGLRELAGGRADLLAEVAGLLEGAREGEPDEPLARQAAGLCRKAGADLEAIPAWIAEGRRRRAAARQPPFSGGLHGGGSALHKCPLTAPLVGAMMTSRPLQPAPRCSRCCPS